ncbi:MAG: hypothetical protein AB4060_00115 [Crocosphaera sp.]
MMKHQKLLGSLLITLTSSCVINTGFVRSQVDNLPDQHPPLPLPVTFSVDINAEGLPVPLHGNPNDVWALDQSGYATEGEVFQSSGATLGLPPDGTNVDRMSSSLGLGPAPGGPPFVGPFAPNPGAPNAAPPAPGRSLGTFGLQPMDNIFSLSYGMDSGNILQFSVTPNTVGRRGTDVFFESTLSPIPTGDPGNEAAGDIFKSRWFSPFGSYIPDHLAVNQLLNPATKLNNIYRDEQELGLQAPANAGANSPEDDLNGLEEADTGDNFWGVDNDVNGVVDNDKYAFFSLGSSSLSLGGTVETADILVADDSQMFTTYADKTDIGLQAGDIVDALVLSDVGNVGVGPSGKAPNGVLDMGDEALFSLAAGSPTLATSNLSAGDVLYTDFDGTFNLYAQYDHLGLEKTDDLNALDIKPGSPPFIADGNGNGNGNGNGEGKHGQGDIINGFGFDIIGYWIDHNTRITKETIIDVIAHTKSGGTVANSTGQVILVETDDGGPFVVQSSLGTEATSVGNGEFAQARGQVNVIIDSNGNLVEDISANTFAFVFHPDPLEHKSKWADAHVSIWEYTSFTDWFIGEVFRFEYDFLEILLGEDPQGILTTQSEYKVHQATNVPGLEEIWWLNILSTIDEFGVPQLEVDFTSNPLVAISPLPDPGVPSPDQVIEDLILDGFVFDPIARKWVWILEEFKLWTDFVVDVDQWELKTHVKVYAEAHKSVPEPSITLALIMFSLGSVVSLKRQK